jgi:flavin reductase (DIM6/NTAB) family NADH-FMN oxidoreductase RutF
MEKVKLKNMPFGPFPAVLVGANVDGKPNYATLGACGVVSMEPVLYVSLKETHYTSKGIRETEYFSVNIPSADLVQKTDYCGVVSGHTTDKSNVFTSFYDEASTAPMVRECPVNYLCKVIKTLPIFGFEMFFGEMVATYVSGECLTDGRLDPQKVNPLMMMYPNYLGSGRAIGSVYKEGAAYRDSLGE